MTRKWSNTLALLAIMIGLTVSAAAAGSGTAGRFSDVPESHWAREEIQRGAELGFVEGFEDGTFRPAQPVSNAQFCAMVTRVFCAEALEKNLGDTAEGWWTPYVRTAYEAGLLEGTEVGAQYEQGRQKECVNESISRYDMARILHRLAGETAETALDEGTLTQVAAEIADWADIPAECREEVAACYALGLLNGMEDGTFRGASAMTRAQACTVVCRAIDLLEEETSGSVQTPQQPSSGSESFVDEVVRLVNEARAKEGLTPLVVDTSAAQAAQVRAEELVSYYGHTRPDGSSCFTALDQAGASYWTAGENIAVGYSTPEAVVEAWMNSASHRANIMSSSFTKIGVGYYHTESGYRDYWVQMFLG